MRNQKELLIVTALALTIFLVILTGIPVFLMLRPIDQPDPITRVRPLASATGNLSLNTIERAATQTALALLGTVEPSQTPAPEVLKDWLPATNSDFRPRFS